MLSPPTVTVQNQVTVDITASVQVNINAPILPITHSGHTILADRVLVNSASQRCALNINRVSAASPYQIGVDFDAV